MNKVDQWPDFFFFFFEKIEIYRFDNPKNKMEERFKCELPPKNMQNNTRTILIVGMGGEQSHIAPPPSFPSSPSSS